MGSTAVSHKGAESTVISASGVLRPGAAASLTQQAPPGRSRKRGRVAASSAAEPTRRSNRAQAAAGAAMAQNEAGSSAAAEASGSAAAGAPLLSAHSAEQPSDTPAEETAALDACAPDTSSEAAYAVQRSAAQPSTSNVASRLDVSLADLAGPNTILHDANDPLGLSVHDVQGQQASRSGQQDGARPAASDSARVTTTVKLKQGGGDASSPASPASAIKHPAAPRLGQVANSGGVKPNPLLDHDEQLRPATAPHQVVAHLLEVCARFLCDH